MTRRPARDEHRPSLGEADHPATTTRPIHDQPFWIDSAVMARRLRDAQTDATLRDDLDRLFPDTLADL